jgi:cyclopropane fatty-acyl-phospholipid synthase-like methyltransferase
MLRKIRFTLQYFGKPRWDTGISPPELLEFIDRQAPGRALDLGCGTGTNAITLARHGWQVTGVDFVDKAIRTARRKAKQAGVEINFYIHDVTQLDHLKEKYDLILDIGCLHSLPAKSRPTYYRNVQRLLAPNGTFLLYGFIKPDLDPDLPGLNETELGQLQKMFKLQSRNNGSDHNSRQSAWFTFAHKENQL